MKVLFSGHKLGMTGHFVVVDAVPGGLQPGARVRARGVTWTVSAIDGVELRLLDGPEPEPEDELEVVFPTLASMATTSSEPPAPFRMTYDPIAGAAYLYLVDNIRHGEAARTIPSQDGTVALDYDAQGHLVGIEIIAAAKLLRPETLARANQKVEL